MRNRFALLLALALPGAARADSPWDIAKGIAGKAATGKAEKEVNDRLLAESRKNQCSFKSDTDQLAPGCDSKMRRLAGILIDAKKQLNGAGLKNFKFEVSGHTDSSGSADHNKELSGKRAAVIAHELVAKGVPEAEIISVGMGSEQLLVKPDNTPAKKARNRRYELRVRL
jgi:outer membrane protein OmpA-like peptidoglycan-associated protein